MATCLEPEARFETTRGPVDHRLLIGCELFHACVIGVVHKVENGIYTGRATCVAADRTTKCGLSLEWRVADEVSRAATSILKGVEQAKVVTGFVGERIAFVVWESITTGETTIEDHDSVQWIAFVVVPWKRCPPEKAATRIANIDIERVRGVDRKRGLHLDFGIGVRARGVPKRIGGHVDAGEIELNPHLGIRCIEDFDLVLKHFDGDIALTRVVGDHVKCHGNRDVESSNVCTASNSAIEALTKGSGGPLDRRTANAIHHAALSTAKLGVKGKTAGWGRLVRGCAASKQQRSKSTYEGCCCHHLY